MKSLSFKVCLIAQALVIPGNNNIFSSISPSSILNPLIFIWPSALPKCSISPLSSHLQISPVLYIIVFGMKGLGIKALSVSSWLAKYPFATPIPPIYNSPGTFTGHGYKFLSKI